jgi:hypothetical protein
MAFIPESPNGQATMANSKPVVIASNQTAVAVTDTTNGGKLDTLGSAIGATNESAAASDTSTSGLNGLVKRLLQSITTLLGKFPSSIGQKAKTDSVSVTLASDQGSLAVSDTANGTKIDGVSTVIGAINEAMPSTDSPTNAGLNGLTRRVINNITVGNTAFGAQADSAATTDTGTFSAISLWKRFFSRAPVAIDADNAALTNTKPSISGGRAEDPASLPAFTVGDAVTARYDKDSGAQFVLQGDLNPRYDGVTFSEAIRVFSFEITRPANTTAYAAEDMIMDNAPGSLNFLNVSTSLTTADSSGYIVKARLVSDDPNIIGMRLSLLMYDSVGSYTLTDNATWIGGGYTQEKNQIATIEFDTITDALGNPVSGDASICTLKDLRIPYKLVNGVNFRLGFVTKDAFTPASGSKFYVELTLSTNP